MFDRPGDGSSTNMPLLETLRPIIEAAQVGSLQLEELDDLNVQLDQDVMISLDTREKSGLFGPHAEVVYVVSFQVPGRYSRDEPPDVDVVDVSTSTSPAAAVASALGVLIQHRVAASQERLADEEQARACSEDY